MNDESQILFCRLHEDAIIPNKRTEDACYDFFACFDEDFISIKPLEMKMIPTQIASVMSPRYAMILHERSSLGAKNISLRAGVVDSGYRAGYNVLLTNLNDVPFIIAKDYVLDEEIKMKLGPHKFIRYSYCKAIAQGLLVEVPKVEVREISKEELETYSSERGKNGFGSTNKNSR